MTIKGIAPAILRPRQAEVQKAQSARSSQHPEDVVGIGCAIGMFVPYAACYVGAGPWLMPVGRYLAATLVSSALGGLTGYDISQQSTKTQS